MEWSNPASSSWGSTYSISDFQADNYRCILSQMTGRGSLDLDFHAIHRFASHMTCWPLLQVSRWLSQHPASSTTELLDFIQSQGMSSNVDTEEVQDVTMEDLIGADHIQEALEENIILPLENNELALRFGLTPKRGIILAGPPGTGKTTVGRTLARRLKGKFFLIDGTMISGTDQFYSHVDRVFRQAVVNAPYLLGAIDALVESRKAYVAAVKRTFSVNADRPRWFNVHPELFEPNTRVHSNAK